MATKTKKGTLTRAQKNSMLSAARTIIKDALPKLAAAEKNVALAKVSEMEVVLVIGKALVAVGPAFADSKAFLAFATRETKKTRSWIYDATNAAKAVNTRPSLASEVGSVQTAARFANLSANEAATVLTATKSDRSYANVSKTISNVKSGTRGSDSAEVKLRKRAEKIAKAIAPDLRRKVGKMSAEQTQQAIAFGTFCIALHEKHGTGTIEALNSLSQAIQKAKGKATSKAKA